MRRWVLGALVFARLTIPAFSAPLFPDVPDGHWAQDAVATLAARGLVEGYPDGTFKGDRAASRWELALIVARLLARMEAEHATFATRAELRELQELYRVLRPELDALGVRVTSLELATAALDQRVEELERIRFRGNLAARVVAQTFVNRGSPALVPLGGGPPTVDLNSAVGSAAGAGGVLPNGLTLNPFVFGLLTVTEWAWGRPLTNGTGFTSVGVLGVDVNLAPDWQAGVDLAAYTSQGDAVVDAFWGLPAPYLSNPFTANASTGLGPAAAGVQPQNQQPYTRLNLDRTWLTWDPATNSAFQTRHALLGVPWEPRVQIMLGAFRHQASEYDPLPVCFKPTGKDADNVPLQLGRRLSGIHVDPLVFVPGVNPNYQGVQPLDALAILSKPDYLLPAFGFQATGHEELGDGGDLSLDWQVLGTRLANGTVDFLAGTGAGYFSHAEGGTVALRVGALDDLTALYVPDLTRLWSSEIRLNFLHAANEASGGAALAVGLLQSAGSPTGDWVNPAGFFINQLGGAGDPRVAGVGSTSDVRPIVTVTGLDGIAGVPGVPNFGGIGPQDQTGYGITVDHVFEQHDLSDSSALVPSISARWAHTDYRPQKNSSYSASGDAFEVKATGRLLWNKTDYRETRTLDLSVRYFSVDPRYDPFIAYLPTPGGIASPLWVSPNFSYFSDLYSLHDTQKFPQNRQGLEVETAWVFDYDYRMPTLPKGLLWLRFGDYAQKSTSLQDVRFSTGSLGASGAGPFPNTPVLGYSPGFMDAVFGPYSAATFFDPGNGNALAGVLEDPRGRVRNWSLAGKYSFPIETVEHPACLATAQVAPALAESVAKAPPTVSLRDVSVLAAFDYFNFSRNSNLSALVPGPAGLAGENQNFVDLTFAGFGVFADYDLTQSFRMRAGYAYAAIYGHLDPLNFNGAFAAATGNPRNSTVDIIQTYPEIGFDWVLADPAAEFEAWTLEQCQKLEAAAAKPGAAPPDPCAVPQPLVPEWGKVTWGVTGRYYSMHDRLPDTQFTTPSVPSLNLNLGPHTGAHPFNWDGWQVWSDFSVEF